MAGGPIFVNGRWVNSMTGAPIAAPPAQAIGGGAPAGDASFQQYIDAFGPEALGAGNVDPNSAIMNPTPAAVAPAPAAAPIDDWTQIAAAYGLGAPPAQGLPATMQPVQLGPAPQTTPSLIDTTKIPQPVAQQLAVSPEIQAMASGQGYAPDVVAKMRANAIQDASNAGLQELSQTKRTLGANGIQGGAAAAVTGNVARRTGQAQSNALGQIDISNAAVGNQNAQFGIGQETQIGQNNMQAANTMALANANALFEGLKSNQTSQNNADQMNTGLQFQRQNDQATMDYNNQKSQWDELNKRFGQSQTILGAWGNAA